MAAPTRAAGAGGGREERHAVVGAQRLVDALAVEEPVIEDRNDRLSAARDRPVDVDCACMRHIRCSRDSRSAASSRSCELALTQSSTSEYARPAACECSTPQQMREADRRTIDEIGIPSIVLMENAGRQVVAAMEAAFDDLADEPRRRAVRPRQQRRRRLRRRAHAAAARRRASVFLLGSVADVRGDARTNLEVLGRLGLHGRRDHERAGVGAALHARSRECDLIVDAMLGTGLPRPADAGCSRPSSPTSTASACRSSRSICRPACRPTRTRSMGEAIEATMTVTLAAPKLPLVLPPADAHARRSRDRRHRHPAAGHRRASRGRTSSC